MGIRIAKHVADNRFGFTVDTVADAVTLLIANVQVALVGVPQHEAMRNQLFGSTFGRHPFRVPDLTNVEMHCDRGYFSETTFLAILLQAGCWLTCTCPRGKWLPFHTVYEGDDRIIILEAGLMYNEVREKIFKVGNKQMRLAIHAYRNGNGKLVLVATTVHRKLTMDLVTTRPRYGDLWHNDREKLREEGFALEFSSVSAGRKAAVHSYYY